MYMYTHWHMYTSSNTLFLKTLFNDPSFGREYFSRKRWFWHATKRHQAMEEFSNSLFIYIFLFFCWVFTRIILQDVKINMFGFHWRWRHAKPQSEHTRSPSSSQWRQSRAGCHGNTLPVMDALVWFHFSLGLQLPLRRGTATLPLMAGYVTPAPL